MDDEITDPLDSDIYRTERDRMEKIIFAICDTKVFCTLADIKNQLSERFNILDMGFATVQQDIWSARIRWVKTIEAKEILTSPVTQTRPKMPDWII